ncbi:MAG: alpha-L-glutamate ligase [bacterium]|nr:alpha-L-glutamate ligase [bacterium]
MIEIIYENEDWLPFFQTALDEISVPYRLNFIAEHHLVLSQPPDDIVYLNRISPSSHTRGNGRALINGEQYLDYLQSYNRRVINPMPTMNYEMSKVEQYRLLKQHGLAYPRSVFSSDMAELNKAARALPFPVLTKQNCSGKGLGIRKFDSPAHLTEYLLSGSVEQSPDGILHVQEYIEPKGNFVTRVEIVDGKLVYAFRSSCEQGFELCPADACRIDQGSGKSSAPDSASSLFQWVESFEHPLVAKYIEISQAAGFDMAGFEFIESQTGAVYTYDINGTTNYSPDVERQSGNMARHAFQEFITRLAK